jgi:arylsulfatase A-like enzyme
MDDNKIDLIKSYYYTAVSYAANQIKRLVLHLKHLNLYSDSLIIITGDHGEDFLEREFAGHNSVTDANIRPGMILKPPTDSNLDVPNNADIIDLLPTIAELVGESPPKQCDGVAWQNNSKSDIPRITERISPDSFTISLEKNSTKAIYTYEENHPKYPTKNQLENGPIDTRYYDTSSRSTGKSLNNIDKSNLSEEKFEELIVEHIRKKKKITHLHLVRTLGHRKKLNSGYNIWDINSPLRLC